MIKRLAHVCFKTDQLDNMVAFYKDVIGLDIKFNFKLEDGFIFGYYFDLGNTTFLEIFDQKGAAQQWGGSVTTMKENVGVFYQHFCLEVEDIESYCQTLKSKNIPVTDIIVGLDHSKQAWIKDPDGNAIEIMEYTKDSLQLQ
jgi:lactoylglutathione lyase